MHNQVYESWKTKYGSKFSQAKYQLIHIAKEQNIDYAVGVKLQGEFLVKRVTKAVNLGIMLHSRLI